MWILLFIVILFYSLILTTKNLQSFSMIIVIDDIQCIMFMSIVFVFGVFIVMIIKTIFLCEMN